MKTYQTPKSKTCHSAHTDLASLAKLAYGSNQTVSDVQKRVHVDKLFENCITKLELAQHFKVSIGLINKLMSEECLPHIKIGRSVRFRLNDVYAWFERKGTKL